MKISYDDNYLFSVAADGSLYCYRVTDKDGRGYRRDKDVAYAEEVLVTKSDMEELVSDTAMHKYMYMYIVCTCTCMQLLFSGNLYSCVCVFSNCLLLPSEF